MNQFDNKNSLEDRNNDGINNNKIDENRKRACLCITPPWIKKVPNTNNNHNK